MTKKQWLSERMHGIGGTDVAAILGLSRYKTPLDVYMEKIGEGVPVIENDRMKEGKIFESAIADMYELKSGFKLKKYKGLMIHPKHPFILGTPDRIILEKQNGNGILEIKRIYQNVFRTWSGEVPDEYLCQLQHYLDISGFQWGEFAVYSGDELFRFFKEIDPLFIKIKNERIIEFWERVQKRIPPEPTTALDIQNYIKVEPRKIMVAVDDTWKVVYELSDNKKQVKDLEKRIGELEEQIKLVMRDSEILSYNESPIATWKEVKTNRIDTKELKEKFPEIAKQITKQTTSRSFLIKI